MHLMIIVIIIIIIAMDSPSPNDLITSRSANYLNKRELSASQGVNASMVELANLWAIIIIERRRIHHRPVVVQWLGEERGPPST